MTGLCQRAVGARCRSLPGRFLAALLLEQLHHGGAHTLADIHEGLSVLIVVMDAPTPGEPTPEGYTRGAAHGERVRVHRRDGAGELRVHTRVGDVQHGIEDEAVAEHGSLDGLAQRGRDE